MFFTAIAAISQEGAIGWGSKLAVISKPDMNHFVKNTLNQVVVMGYNTAKSIGKPLPQRANYVLVFNEELKDRPIALADGYTVIRLNRSSLGNVLHMIASDHPDCLPFIIGGAKLYEACAPYCSRLLLTHVNQSNPHADVFFPKEAFSGYNEVRRTDLSDGSVVVESVNPVCLYGIHVV